jgi:hypothetical protein
LKNIFKYYLKYKMAGGEVIDAEYSTYSPTGVDAVLSVKSKRPFQDHEHVALQSIYRIYG